MRVLNSELPGVVIIEPRLFGDHRGTFFEAFRADRYAEVGIPQLFVQDNFSRSRRGVLRGLHFQWPRPQGKLVSVFRGAVLDIAVDIRRGSPHFSKWVAVELSEHNARQMWIPPGFAHGFVVLSEMADFMYKCTEFYVPEHDRAIAWNDPDLAIRWPVEHPELSPKDAAAPFLRAITELPTFSPGTAL